MIKKLSVLLVIVALLVVGITSCSKEDNAADKISMKVGMVTDAGTIDDKSFNQGTWEGILRAKDDMTLDTKYLKPTGETPADYLREIGNLYDAGYKFIVTPGYKFETAIFEAQTKYKDAKFVLLDGYPHAGDWAPVINDNVVSIFFTEHESGFLAGVASALQIEEGEMGFIGGMEIPAVQKFNWGFQQGLKYANDTYDTKIVIKAENVIYQGTFTDKAAGQQIAAQMFDKGVKAIFCAAGGVGVGGINEAKSRTKAGEEVWIIGVDVDQYAEGIYEGNKSVILTSAMKYIDQAAYDMIKFDLDGKFPGGEMLYFDATNNGIGIPKENPNLDKSVVKKVDDVFKKLVSGDVKVSDEKGNLIK